MFIKLSTIAFNTRFIQKILIKPEHYEVYLKEISSSGTIIFGSGGYTISPEIWKIYKGSNYDIITNYLNQKQQNN